MTSPIGLVVGLGNPGPGYAHTRHNAGFWFVDALAERGGERFRALARCFGSVCPLGCGDRALRLFKPDTYMNQSGRAVAAIAQYFRYPAGEILIAHDDIDLPPGTLRLKRGGGHGGHNGLRDIIPALGAAEFARLRIGVGHPGSKDAVVGYVLERAPAGEQALIEAAIGSALDEFPAIAAGELEVAMNVLHREAPED